MPERVEVIVKSGSYGIQIFLLFNRSLLACRRALERRFQLPCHLFYHSVPRAYSGQRHHQNNEDTIDQALCLGAEAHGLDGDWHKANC